MTVVSIVALLAAHPLWLPPIGAFLIVSEPPVPSDAVAPLAGDSRRVAAAAALWRQGLAPRLVLSDMWVDATAPPGLYAQMVREQAVGLGVPAEAIVTAPGRPASTYREARNLRALAEREGWRSVTVVTSAFHTRRSRLILDEAFAGSSVAVRVTPVAGDPYAAGTWWRSARGWQATLSEYAKLLLYAAGYHRICGR
ncbi:MAG: YdcF family protein [Chloroflexota bacterium]